jgi:hypothetical protein
MIKIDWRSIPTSGPDLFPEFEKIEQLAIQRYKEVGDGKLAVEIGSFEGRSSSLLAQYFNTIAIDCWGGNDNSPFGTAGEFTGPFIKNMKDRDLLIKRVFPVISDSSFLDKIPPLNAEFTLVDGDHHYEPCYSDAFRLERHLVPGGYMIIHDFQRRGPTWPHFADPHHTEFASVDRAARDFLSVFKNFEVIEHFCGVLALKKTRN